MSSQPRPGTRWSLPSLGLVTDPSPLPEGDDLLPTTSLVGRAHDIAAVSALLQQDAIHLVTLTGAGGVGKTRLALACASEVESRFRDGVVHVPLSRITDDDQVCAAIARALELRVMGQDPALQRITQHLADKRLLLLLDNFEHVVQASARLARVLHDAPGVTALVTSRVRLRLSTEQEYVVTPLGLPETMEDPAAAPAVRLFLERMPAQMAAAASPQTHRAIAGIVTRLDGLPLAIELAAARTNVLPPAALMERLDQRLPLLTGGSRDLPRRQQTMRDTIAWSYDLLSPRDQQVFRALSVFRGGFSLAAAEQLGQAIGLGGALAVVDSLTTLTEQSLMRPAPEVGGGARFTMYETVREFGWERLCAHGEEDALQAAHAAVTLANAEAAAAELYGQNQSAYLDLLEADQPNLRATFAWAPAHDPAIAMRLCQALLRFWPIRGCLSDGRKWLELVLAMTERSETPDDLRAAGMVTLAWILYWQGDFQRAHDLAVAALGRQRAAKNRRGEGDALRVLGHATIGLACHGDQVDALLLQEARETFQQQIPIWEDIRNATGLAMAQHNLGFVAMHAGQRADAAARFEAAAAQFGALGDRWTQALTLTYLANLDQTPGSRQAAERLDTALAIFADLNDQWKVAYTLDAAAAWLRRAGQPDRAAMIAQASVALLARDGIAYSRAHSAGVPPAFSTAELAAIAPPAGPDESRDNALALARRWLQEDAPAPDHEPATPEITLTARERDVLRLLSQGYSDRRIAEELRISPRTVGGHVTRLLGKLGAESRTAAATSAVRRGLV
ncbi:MAG: LuxR C-terminal-related transcriptional regulator [Thermomicrobiales bacterium]